MCNLLFRIFVIVCGMLYPAFYSYKAVKEKDVRAYVHWMMYWIVFALYTTLETFADPLLSFWFPFYYELKIVFFFWLIFPSTRGASFVYRRLIHPIFVQHEEEIDSFIVDFKKRTTDYVFRWLSQLMTVVTENVWQAAIRARGGGGTDTSATPRSYNPDRVVSVSADNSPTSAFDWNRVLMFNQGLMKNAFSYNEINTVVGNQQEDQCDNQMYGSTGVLGYEEEARGPTTRARGARKKKEVTNTYGTLPRTRRTRKDA